MEFLLSQTAVLSIVTLVAILAAWDGLLIKCILYPESQLQVRT